MNMIYKGDIAQRTRQKREQVLSFLQSELYTTASILAEHLQVAKPGVYPTLDYLIRYKLARKQSYRLTGVGRQITVYLVTQHGATEDGPGRVHKGKLPQSTLAHTFDVQRTRVNCKLTEWVGERWLPGRGPGANRWPTYPDAVATAVRKSVVGGREEVRVAVEIERTRKAPARYKDIIKKHLANIEEGRYAGVLYFCPTLRAVESLSNIFQNLSESPESNYFNFFKYPFNGEK